MHTNNPRMTDVREKSSTTNQALNLFVLYEFSGGGGLLKWGADIETLNASSGGCDGPVPLSRAAAYSYVFL